MTKPILLVEHLSHIYQSGSIQKAALVDVSLEIERGSCVAIIGVTGSGKTTLVQHFNGLLQPASGQILFDGLNISGSGVDLHVLRQRVGMLFQFPESQLFENTVYADVAFGPQRMHLSRREIRTRVHAALATVGLPAREYAMRSPFDLSGGQRRRIALAGVLAMSPSVLILDEPTVGLDADGRDEFYRYIRAIQCERGVTIILVSHDMTEVATMADKLFVLHNGHLAMQGSPREVFTRADELHSWGLAVPPLSALLSLLRQQGVAIPDEVFTLDEAFTWLSEQYIKRNCVLYSLDKRNT